MNAISLNFARIMLTQVRKSVLYVRVNRNSMQAVCDQLQDLQGYTTKKRMVYTGHLKDLNSTVAKRGQCLLDY